MRAPRSPKDRSPTDNCTQPATLSTSADEVRREIGHEGAAGGEKLGRLHRHRGPHRAANQTRRHRDRPLQDQQVRPLWPGQPVHVHRAVTQRVGGQVERSVPERTGALEDAGLLDLPVKPAIGHGEARIGRRSGQFQLSIGPAFQPGNDLVELHGHLGHRAALHMRAEELRKTQRRKTQCEQDRQRARQREAQAQAHAASR